MDGASFFSKSRFRKNLSVSDFDDLHRLEPVYERSDLDFALGFKHFRPQMRKAESSASL